MQFEIYFNILREYCIFYQGGVCMGYRDYNLRLSFNKETQRLIGMGWTNDKDLEDSPNGGPSFVQFHENGALCRASWSRNGRLHRGDDLPASIEFDEQGRPEAWDWYRDGNCHRDGGKPASISFWDGSLTALKNLCFYRRGERFRLEGKPFYIDFDPDGGGACDHESKDVTFEGFDPSWLPSPVPTVELTQPYLLISPFLRP